MTIDQEELSIELTAFICDKGLWNEFLEFMKKKGYSEEDLEDA